MNKLYGIISLILLISCLHGQAAPNNPNDVQIRLRRAQTLMARQNWKQAISAYQNLAKSYPNNQEVIKGLFNVLSITKKTEDLQQAYDTYGKVFPRHEKLRWQVVIAAGLGNNKQAVKLVDDYLELNSNDMGAYSQAAGYLLNAGLAQEAVTVYKQAQELSQDPQLYASETARALELAGDYTQAGKYYLLQLLRQPNYSYYAFSRIRQLYQKDEQVLTQVQQVVAESESEPQREVLARLYQYAGNTQQALQLYTTLKPQLLYNFAKEMQAQTQFNIAAQAWSKYISISDDQPKIYDAQVQLGQVYLQLGQTDKAKQALLSLYNNKDLSDKKLRWRTSAGLECRRLLAHIALLNDDFAQAVTYLTQAKDFAFNQGHKKELDLQIARLTAMQGNTKQAQQMLDQVTQNEEAISPVRTQAAKLAWYLAIMQGQPADSLLAEVLLLAPQDSDVSQMLYLTNASKSLSAAQTKGLLKAMRYQELQKPLTAFAVLDTLYASNPADAIAIMGGRWAESAKEDSLAARWYNVTYSDSINTQYATLKQAEADSSKATSVQFLTTHPGSIFAPAQRQVLQQDKAE